MIQNLLLKPLFYYLLLHSFAVADDPSFYVDSKSDGSWQGKWFPYSPNAKIDPNPVTQIYTDLYDLHHGIAMGIKDRRCDDGKTNLQMDWDFDPINYTCFVFNRRTLFRARSDVQPIYSREHIPQGYNAPHKCMSEPINYSTVIPTYGTHRPLWAKYGEYTFLPRQRWVHNLEHGAVVMLYHPCADKNEVNTLRILVKKCLYRHIITPYNLLSSERPLALVTWGHKIEMSKVAPEIVIDFIKKHALKGPEQTSRDGQYRFMLENHANIVSDISDHQLCKFYNFIQ